MPSLYCQYCKTQLKGRRQAGEEFNKDLITKLCPVCDAPGRVPPGLAELVGDYCETEGCRKSQWKDGQCANHWRAGRR